MDYHSNGVPSHLNATQFATVKSLTQIPYVESPADGITGDTRAGKLDDAGLGATPAHYYAQGTQQANASMIGAVKSGTVDPVHVGGIDRLSQEYGGRSARVLDQAVYGTSMLGNGGHRVAVASHLRAHVLPVTPDRQDSGADHRESAKIAAKGALSPGAAAKRAAMREARR